MVQSTEGRHKTSESKSPLQTVLSGFATSTGYTSLIDDNDEIIMTENDIENGIQMKGG